MILRNRADLARLIKSGLALRGETLTAFADRVGVSRVSLSRSVNRSDLPFSDILRLASLLGFSLRVELIPDEESGLTRTDPGDLPR